MKVLFVAPEEKPVVKEIGDSLHDMQEAVGGYIQALYPWRDEVALICNEEGKLLGLPFNRPLFDDQGNMIDILVGSFFLCLVPNDSDQFLDFPDHLVEQYTQIFAPMYINVNR